MVAHAQKIEDVFSALQSNRSGLSQQEAQERLKKYGPNKLSEKKRISAFAIFLDQFKNSLTLVLLGSVVLILFIYFFGERDQSDLIEAGLIFAIVLMIAVLGFVQEFKAEKALESLKKLLAYKAKVHRGGIEEEVDVIDLVPGDIVILEEGMKIPADIRLLEIANLNVNESSLTGESSTVRKSTDVLPENTQLADQKNLVFAGTVITSGRGLGIVVRTGDTTEIGKIAKMVAEEKEEETPMQKKLDAIGKMIGMLVLGISIIVFLFIVFFASSYTSLSLLQRIIHSFIAAVALAIAAIPEGLPAVVTISLALGTQRMVKKNALVRKLSSVESLGSTDVICSDKTGTLTKNEMTVTEIYHKGKTYDVSGTGYEIIGTITEKGLPIDTSPLATMLEAGLFCNNAVLRKGLVLGDPTEAALLVSAIKGKIGTLEAAEHHPERVYEVPFTSERKAMSVVIKKNEKLILYSKGAPEAILANSTSLYSSEQPMHDDDREEIMRKVNEMNSHALRTLGFAYKELTAEEYDKFKNDEIMLEKDTIFLGLQGMMDPAREEVKELIQKCKTSGIRTIMITGDHEITAKAVAQQIGLEGESMSGEKLESISEKELLDVVEHISVYARINPGSKMKIVSALKKNGHVVAMTGDGVNDAPALKKADIGIAMGITGTDVAKEAADMVLLDDKFSTIVSAIEEGRGIYQNIRKFVQYLLSCNIGEVLIVFFGIMIFKDIPLTATMLLWINVVTDGLPAVALGMDRPAKDIMLASPKKFQSEIITKKLWVEMLLFGFLLTIAVLGLYQYNVFQDHADEAKGAAFISIAMFELAYLFIVRSGYNTPFFSNKWLHAAIFVTIILQVAIVYIPFFANLFELSNIDTFDWIYIFVATLIISVLFKSFKKQLSI